MRISIWQQFSSNHSSHYWVAGHFKTVEDAGRAKDELHHILEEIYRWRKEHSQEVIAALRTGSPHPPEVAFATQYDVKWPQQIDQMDRDRAITIVGKVVTVSNPDQTWMSRQPFEGLLQRLGAEVIGYDTFFKDMPEDFELHSILKFTAPDRETADKIEKSFRAYLAGDLVSPENVPPWNDDEANFARTLDHSPLLRREYVDILRSNWQRHFEVAVKLDNRVEREALERLALYGEHSTLSRHNLTFTFEDFWFWNQELAVSALIAWLEANNCTEIDLKYAGNPNSKKG